MVNSWIRMATVLVISRRFKTATLLILINLSFRLSGSRLEAQREEELEKLTAQVGADAC